MRLLIAPDSFKGSLTSVEVAEALADRLAPRPSRRRGRPRAARRRRRGHARRGRGGRRLDVARRRDAHDPLGRTVRARVARARRRWRPPSSRWRRRPGCRLVAAHERDAAGATSRRDGRRPARRARRGHPRHRARDRRQRDHRRRRGPAACARGDRLGRPCDRRPRRPRPAARGDPPAHRLRRDEPAARPSAAPPRLRAAEGRDAGRRPRPRRASRRLRGRPRARDRAPRARDRRAPGAAGGVGFGLLCAGRPLRIAPPRAGRRPRDGPRPAFDAKLADADLVLTGEGRIDEQTAYGKTALGVARRARDAGKPCIAVGGGVTPEGIDALAARRRRGGRR